MRINLICALALVLVFALVACESLPAPADRAGQDWEQVTLRAPSGNRFFVTCPQCKAVIRHHDWRVHVVWHQNIDIRTGRKQ